MSVLVLELASDLERSLSQSFDPAAARLPLDLRVLNRAPLGSCYQVCRGYLLISQDETLRTQWVERTVRR